MVQVVVVGGGFAGLSVAARLAKLHHQVTLLEASDRLGGGLHGVEIDGTRWDLHSPLVTLPGVFRDLFRKSGRPMDKTLGLEHGFGRRHVFADGTTLDLPMGNRGDQHEAVTEAFGDDAWSPFVDGYADTWEVLRRRSLDVVLEGPEAFDRAARSTLEIRRMMRSINRRRLSDERLRKIVLDPVRHEGLDRGSTPQFLAMWHWVERNFGRWRFEGDGPGLAAALERRLTERKVTVLRGVAGHRVLRTDGHVTGVEADDGVHDAQVVVWCHRTMPQGDPQPPGIPAVPASRTLLRLAEDPPELAPETLVHANPPVVLHSSAPGTWTLEHRSGEDPLNALARFGINLRDLVLERHDLSPSEMVALTHDGWAWLGWTSMFRRPGVAPTGGLYHAGAHAHPGPRLEQIGMATAAIAAHVGPGVRV